MSPQKRSHSEDVISPTYLRVCLAQKIKKIAIEKGKKRYTRPQMFGFSLKVSVKRKKVFIVRDEAPIFSEALGFSLLILYVNRDLCLQSIFSLSIYDMSNLGGRQTHGSCFWFLFPHPTNKILKKTSVDLSSFLGFNFDGRPIIL